jgi:hypothetical protein
MKTFSYLGQYFAKFFLKWEMYWTKVVVKIKTHFLCSVTFFRNSHSSRDNAEKCGGEWGATNDVTIWRIRVACWISKVTCTYANSHPLQHTNARTHTQTQICNPYCFLLQQWFTNVPQYYVIRTLSSCDYWPPKHNREREREREGGCSERH